MIFKLNLNKIVLLSLYKILKILLINELLKSQKMENLYKWLIYNNLQSKINQKSV